MLWIQWIRNHRALCCGKPIDPVPWSFNVVDPINPDQLSSNVVDTIDPDSLSFKLIVDPVNPDS